MMTLRSLREWSLLGYKIKKGSKAVAFQDGLAQFSPAQVERPPWYGKNKPYRVPDYTTREYSNQRRSPSIANGSGERDDYGDCNCGVGWGCSCRRSSVMGASSIRAEQEAQARHEESPYRTTDWDHDEAEARWGYMDAYPGADGWGLS